jgi:thymidylate kinase
MANPIFVFSGLPAAGKSTVAAALLKHFPLGIHIPVDTIRNWVVSGLSDPIGSWDPETEQQFRLARQAAVQIARTYAVAGFAVVIDDVIMPEHFEAHYQPHFGEFTPYQIMLRPPPQTALARSVRRRKEFNTAQLNKLIPRIDDYLNQYDLTALGWHVVDNSSLSVEDTAQEILSRVAMI